MYHAYTVIRTYSSYQVNVNLKITTQGELVFPAVTVCNVNPIKQSALDREAETNELLKQLTDKPEVKRQSRRKRALGEWIYVTTFIFKI